MRRLLPIVALLGCSTPSPVPCDWAIGFEGAAPSDVEIVAVEIREGGCDGEVIAHASEIDVGEARGPMPPELPAGTYGLAASARDAGCSVLARGCLEVELPGGCEDLRVVLAEVAPSAACSAPTCDEGRCGLPIDAGPGGCVGSGRRTCEGACVDTRTDVAHCGACGEACADHPDGEAACVDGECRIACDDPTRGDCDSEVDGCETALDTDADCGGCGAACDPANAAGRCVGGTCTVTACDDGFEDCDGRADTGCEASLSRPETCGDCDTACADPTPLCDEGACVSGCSPPRDDMCSGACVDLDASLAHCGSCGEACARDRATAVCDAGSCSIDACDAGWADCDDDDTTGCETFIHGLDRCGSCDGPACDFANASESCEGGTCAFTSCAAGFDDCNGDVDADGCETATTTLTDCGGCGTPCSLPNATETCAGGSCEVDTCEDGWLDCTDAPGCETPGTDSPNCRACGRTCPAVQVCGDSGCECPPGCGACLRTACSTSSPCVCEGGCACDFTCPGVAAGSCSARCRGADTTCQANGGGAISWSGFRCEDGARCAVDPNGTSFNGTCTGAGTQCDVDCRGVMACDLDCEAGASCVLRCNPSIFSCDIDGCHAGAPMTCSDGAQVCNASCPS